MKFQPYFRLKEKHSRSAVSYTPLQLAATYQFPVGLTGTGQKIGIIELGGGYLLADIRHYLQNYLQMPYEPNLVNVSVDGARNNPYDGSGANVEVALDIEIIAALAPEAQIRVYFAPNTANGFYHAIATAQRDGCAVISISWGAPENAWDSSALQLYNTLFQQGSAVVCAASGDNGSSDGESGLHVDFPASSPAVLACGGTHLDSSGAETVWSDTGGGVSSVFDKPAYQSQLAVAKRGVPDVAGNADPETGYNIYCSTDGGLLVVGGTSAVAPLWAALLARIFQQQGGTLGEMHSFVYEHTGVCRDITQGSNGAYRAQAGWDACTGLGSPIGQSFLTNPPTDGGGGGDVPVIPTPTEKPRAEFSAMPLFGVYPLGVHFIDESSGVPTEWMWSFGDGAGSGEQSPVHTYQRAGRFNVSLTVRNSLGKSTLRKYKYIYAYARRRN